MKKNIKKALVTISCGIALFLSGLTLPNWSIATGADLVFKEDTLSANLDGVSLKVLLEKISREKGIWIKGKGSVLEGKVSLQFRDLSLRDGLRRILAQYNHSLVFNRAGRLIGLYVVEKGNSQTAGTLTTNFKIDKSGHLHDGPGEISDGPPLDGPANVPQAEPLDGPANAPQDEL